MKPIKLEFMGINSYTEKTEIDFTKLFSSGLFGIFGNTGSGKSTILDCIFLALYSKTTKSSSSVDFINNLHNYAYVDLIFQVFEDGKSVNYRAFHEFKLKQNQRANGSHKARLSRFDDGVEVPVCDGVDAVKARIKEIISLDVNEFEKCIILPQGEFSAFVKMQRPTRLNMMGSLFGLDKYGEKLYKKIKLKVEELKLKLSELEGKISLLDGVSPEAVKDLEKELLTLEKEKKFAEDEVFKSREKFMKIEQKYLNKQMLESEEKRLSLLLKGGEEFVKKENALRLFNIAEELKNLKSKKQASLSKQKGYLDSLSVQKEQKLKYEIERNYLDGEKQKIDEYKAEITFLTSKKASLDLIKGDIENLSKLNKERQELLNAYNQSNDKVLSLEDSINKYLIDLNKYPASELDKINARRNKIINSFSSASSSVLLNDELSFLNSIKEIASGEICDKISARIKEISSKLSGESYEIKALLVELDKIIKASDEFVLNKQKISEELSNKKQALALAVSKRDEALESGRKTKRDIDSLKDKINSITNGEEYHLCLNAVKSKIDGLNEKIDSIEKRYSHLSEDLSECDKKIKLDQSLLDNEIVNFNELAFEIEKLEARFNDDLSYEEVLKIVDNYDKLSREIESRKSEILICKNNVNQLKNNLLDVEISKEIFEKEQESLKDKEKLLENCNNIIYNKQSKLNEINQSLKLRQEIESQKDKVVCEYNDNEKLLSVVKSRALVEFVSEEYLKEICYNAKQTLLKLSDGRFGLCYEGDFFVEDNLLGGEMRKVDTVSGGELFLVSLSLALALSTSIYSKTGKPMEFFFLDEGFGSLDRELVETVINSLNKLKKQDLCIGIITHVDSLKDAITAKICVEGATPISGSTVKIYS